ncbi:MAG: SDR family NAD(P)-dependent oxidoreductase, partial [Myxococcota bacterium]|nr:SDR family NAD(P)-dependent oxidoreductase [Myxococcota bacterium]
LSYEDTLDLMILRGVLTTKAPAGAMTSVALSPDELKPLLEGEIDLAIINTPQLCVASGAVDAVEALERKLEEKDIDFRRIAVPVAGHSRMFEPILDEFRAFLQSRELRPPQIPFISNRTGKLITDEQATDPNYWVDHLRHTVFFADGISTLLSKPGRVLIEVGPGQALCSFAKQHPSARQDANVIPSMRHRDDELSDSQFFLASLGRCWASGLDIDLTGLREGETRKRVPLPTYAWSHQRYFIEPTVVTAQEEDLTNLERVEDLADWAHVPVWEHAPATRLAENKPQTWLLFMDDAGLGQRLRKRLLARGHTVVCVESADAFFKKSEDTYALAPERGRAGYDALVQDLVATGKVPTHIAHLWLVTDRERFRPGSSFFHQNLQDGFYSLFFLAQSLGDENVPTPLHIDVVTNGMQAVGEGDAVLYPEKATVLGPVKVIPRELPGITCRSIDVRLQVRPESTLAGLVTSFKKRNEGGKETLDRIAEALEEELQSESECEVVAYRDGERFARRYRAEKLAPVASEAGAAMREGGTYLITGGLGGLGLTMAERLATELKANLVLVGRTPLPEREEWDDWLRSRGGSDVVGRKIRKIQELENAGADVLVCSADVTNHDQMRDVFQTARDRFGSVHGVIHTAGVVKDELIQLKLESDIADVFSPKVHGTVVLDSLLEEAGVELLVLFSSTSSIAAPAGQVDYVAANAYLDAYAQKRAGSPVRTVAINWGIWNEVGMAAESFGGEGEATPGVEARMKTPAHPLFEAREKDSHGRTVFSKTYSAAGDWVLDEHRTHTGHALLPGTGYPELARAALAEYDETGPFEIRDLYFLRPLYVPDDETRDVRVMLVPNERGYRFEVRTKCQLEGRTAWELNAQAGIEYGHLDAPATLDLSEIDARCQRSRSDVNPEGHKSGQEHHVRFGPRWRVLRQVFYGEDEALAELELPDPFASDLPGFGLHPALLDYSTGYAMELISGYVEGEALWVPVSYGRFAVHDTLPKRVFSWVRNHAANSNDNDFAVFDITITDETGRVLLEIEEFTIHKLAESIDFGVTAGPTRADVEFEAALGSGNERDLSPAELRLRRNYERGIKPEEGSEALARVVAGQAHPQVAVSSLDLHKMMRQVETSTEQASEGGTRFERPELDSEFVEARDEVERTLVGFWEELLGVQNLGVCDSFFDLGGHSLIAVRLFSMIKKAYSVEFPISVLFEAPTIEGCADLIKDAIGGDAAAAGDGAAPASETRRTRFKYLVAMHQGEGGPKTPFFLVAGMFGNVLNLRHLANLVGGDRPFYGVQAQGLYGDEPPHETFEEMAEAYIAEMRTVQPNGPYFVGGFSGGGLTAFEIAHQLRKAGEEVGLLLLLDSRLPQTPRLTRVDRARIQWQRLQQRGPGYAIDWARNRAKWQIEQIQARFADEEDLGHTEDQFHNSAIEAAFLGALPRYTMEKYPGKLVLFRPKQDRAYVLGEDRVLDSAKEWVWHDNGFGQYADSIDIFEMPGDHDSMVLEPNVRVMAQQLQDCIAEAEARGKKG